MHRKEQKLDTNRVIVALSGGKASAWCADWALRTFAKEQVILYFNDTKWEHPDLYRFLSDLENYFDHPITRDSDGRSPEELFFDQNAIANQRMPFCSRILKAERLQAFYQDGDTLIFGIGVQEPHRAKRLIEVYDRVSQERGKKAQLRFPLIAENVSRLDINLFLQRTGIEEPELYKYGFSHNNCGGACVRAGKAQWMKVYKLFPELYAERERVEKEMQEWTGKPITFLTGESLEEFRRRVDAGTLTRRYANTEVREASEREQELQELATALELEPEDTQDTECIGVCSFTN